MSHYLFTSESVTEGHPDKICDQISDAVLDAILEQDPYGRVACETAVSTGLVHIMGEISTSCYVDIAKITREVIRSIGYDRAKYGFDCDTCGIITNIDEQSGDIALGVDRSLESKQGEADELQNGAGDQGMMFGYACRETPELMPLPISLSHALARRLAEVRKSGLVPYLRPDGKTQVTVEYDEARRPVRVDTIVISTQHAPEATLDMIRRDMLEQVVRPVIPAELLDGTTPTAAAPRTAAAPSPARTRRRWTAARPTPPAGWPRRWWPPAWPTAARCSWPTPSAWRGPCPCLSRPSERERRATRCWPRRWKRSSTCAPRPSSATSICAARSTAPSPLTATWAARIWA